MEQETQLDYLLKYLLKEHGGQGSIEPPEGYAEKRALFRALVNMRPPQPVSDDFLRVQDAFLQEEAQQKGVVGLDEIPPCKINSRISLWQGDITRLAVDAIVNAANSEMLGCFVPKHHCIDNAIHTAAGIQLREECHAIMAAQGHSEGTGLAKITKGHNLPAKYVIHTVGPIVNSGVTAQQKQELVQCYQSCLNIAVLYGIRSIAFCCVSTGVFAFPKKLAAQIAIDTVRRWLERDSCIKRVIFNVFTDEDYQIYRNS